MEKKTNSNSKTKNKINKINNNDNKKEVRYNDFGLYDRKEPAYNIKRDMYNKTYENFDYDYQMMSRLKSYDSNKTGLDKSYSDNNELNRNRNENRNRKVNSNIKSSAKKDTTRRNNVNRNVNKKISNNKASINKVSNKNKKTKVNYKRVFTLFCILFLIVFSIYSYFDNKKIRVIIDPGHGGNDTGAINDTRYEKDDTLELAKIIKTKLMLDDNIKVILTRNKDDYVSLEDRVKISNKKKAKLFISLHRNDSPSGNGVEIWIGSKRNSIEKDVAEKIMKSLNEGNISRNRGVKAGTAESVNDDYYVNKNTKADSMIIELGFMNNTLDNTLYDQNISDYAKRISNVIKEAVKIYYMQTDIDESLDDN